MASMNAAEGLVVKRWLEKWAQEQWKYDALTRRLGSEIARAELAEEALATERTARQQDAARLARDVEKARQDVAQRWQADYQRERTAREEAERERDGWHAQCDKMTGTAALTPPPSEPGGEAAPGDDAPTGRCGNCGALVHARVRVEGLPEWLCIRCVRNLFNARQASPDAAAIRKEALAEAAQCASWAGKHIGCSVSASVLAGIIYRNILRLQPHPSAPATPPDVSAFRIALAEIERQCRDLARDPTADRWYADLAAFAHRTLHPEMKDPPDTSPEVPVHTSVDGSTNHPVSECAGRGCEGAEEDAP